MRTAQTKPDVSNVITLPAYGRKSNSGKVWKHSPLCMSADRCFRFLSRQRWCWLPPPPALTPASLLQLPPQTQIAATLAELGFEKTDESYVVNLPGPLLFETGSNVLNDSAKVRLATLAEDLDKLEIRKSRLFGHTDNVASAEFNRSLSGKRAEVVAREISRTGLCRKILSVVDSDLIALSLATTRVKVVRKIVAWQSSFRSNRRSRVRDSAGAHWPWRKWQGTT